VARYSFIGIGTRIFVLILLLIFLIVGGIVWFDRLGIIDAKDIISPITSLLGMQKRTVIKDIDDPLLLERERLKKQADSFELIEEDLNKKEATITRKEKEVTQLADTVKEKEKEVADKETSFKDQQKSITDRKTNLLQTSEYLVGMNPKVAVDILVKMEDNDVIDIFRVTEETAKKSGELSMVSVWLSMMPNDRAATLNRKMARAEPD
jgi:flagellar protein FlbB